jgi:hypothetical protein
LVFWGNHRNIAYSFHKFSVFCLSIVLFLLYYVFCVWALKFFITLVPICWGVLQLHFFWFKELFVSRVSIWFFSFFDTFQTFVKLLFNMSYCFLYFINLIYYNFLGFVLMCYWNKLWVKLDVSVSSPVFYPDSLSIHWVVLYVLFKLHKHGCDHCAHLLGFIPFTVLLLCDCYPFEESFLPAFFYSLYFYFKIYSRGVD